MPHLGSVTFSGKSGKPYRFRVYPLGTTFKEGVAAVFVLTRRKLRQTTGRMRHRPLSVGHSGNLHQPEPEATAAMSTGAANCICIHPDSDPASRSGIQQDLSAMWSHSS